MASSMQVAQANDQLTLSLSGDLSMQTVPQLTKRLLSQLSSSQKNVVLDLNQVQRLDSAGLALLLSAIKTAKRQGKTLQITQLPETSLSLIEAYGLTAVLCSTGE